MKIVVICWLHTGDPDVPRITSMSADAVSLKLPSLWTNDVETWFAQAEAQFALRDITNETTKFHHVVSVLSADVASKVSSILRSPPGHNPSQQTPSKLQQFLGMINFYRKFLPNGAALLKPLYEAVKGTHKKTQLNWTSDMQTAFNAAKCSLSVSTTLAHPLPNSTIALTTDASDIDIGACLEQHTERGWQPISFFSKKPEEK